MHHHNRMSKKNQQTAGELIQQLQEKFPSIFPHKPLPKVPLMIGIDKQLLAIKDELEVDEKTIRNALCLWCQGARYWANLIVAGRPRIDLYGHEVGFVTEFETIGIRKLMNLPAPASIDRKIEDLGLTVRTCNMLKKAKINFESELKSRLDTLNEIMGMGKKSLEEIKSNIK